MKDFWTIQLPYVVRTPPHNGNRTIDARRTPRSPGVQNIGVHADDELDERSERGTLNEAAILERICPNVPRTTSKELG